MTNYWACSTRACGHSAKRIHFYHAVFFIESDDLEPQPSPEVSAAAYFGAGQTATAFPGHLCALFVFPATAREAPLPYFDACEWLMIDGKTRLARHQLSVAHALSPAMQPPLPPLGLNVAVPLSVALNAARRPARSIAPRLSRWVSGLCHTKPSRASWTLYFPAALSASHTIVVGDGRLTGFILTGPASCVRSGRHVWLMVRINLVLGAGGFGRS